MSVTEVFDNNKIHLIGLVANNPKFSHEVLTKEKIYEFDIECHRTSDYVDVLRCLIPEVFIGNVIKGKTIEIVGEIRTRNVASEDNSKNHLEIRVFVMDEPVICEDAKHSNKVYLKGFVCKEPVYRKTPLGREIADLLIAVNRPYKKSDYIPCIAWGRNALIAQNYDISTKIEIKGRLQSRVYHKRTKDDVCEARVAYEVSASSIMKFEVKMDEE